MSFAQKQANIWYFGRHAGIDFNTSPPTPLPDGKVAALEGSASIADTEGRLLLYTDGMTVWNKNHKVIASGLHSHETSTQPAVIVPHPGNKYQYFVFTTDAFDFSRPEVKQNRGLSYTLVDLSLHNGKGGVVELNVNLFRNGTEKLTAVQTAGDCRNTWVISHPFGSDQYLAYRVDENGVDHQPVISKAGHPQSGSILFARGNLKASPDGKKLACAVHGELVGPPLYGGWLEVYDFDAGTGQVSNAQLLSSRDPRVQTVDQPIGFYGVAFSPDNTKLFAACNTQPVFQFDLNDLNKPPARIGRGAATISLQLGPDGKMYCMPNAVLSGLNLDPRHVNYLHVIHSPNLWGEACDFRPLDFLLGPGPLNFAGYNSYNFPNFIQSYFYRGSHPSGATIAAEGFCQSEPTRFRGGSRGLIERWEWDFGDPASGAANGASGQSAAHTYTTPGTYTVRLLATNPCGQTDTVVQRVEVYPDPLVRLAPGFVSVCYNQVPVRLEAPALPGASYRWSNGATTPFASVSTSGWHRVTVTNACRSRADSVLVEVVPRVQAYMPSDTVVCDGNFAELDARNPGASYRWSTGQTTRTVQTARPGTYSVEVRNRCSAVVDTVRLYFVPEEAGVLTHNVFTPNGDGINDVFVNYVRQVPGYRMQVFSRWGNAVFDSTDAHRHWDGTHQGQPLAEGVYYYAIQTQDCRGRPLRLKGAVTLLR